MKFRTKSSLDSEPRTKNCPDCREELKPGARLCRFCGWKSPKMRRSGECRRCGGYFKESIPVYAIVLAIVFFPLGLFFLLIKERRCGGCGSR